MSRIYDALRKSEQEKTGQSSSAPWSERLHVKASVASREEIPGAVGNVEYLRPRIAPERHILTCEENPAPGVERFRVLRHRLQKIRADRQLKKLLISSAVPKEGKTLVAVNLAFSLAKISRRVLLIDADLRHPSVHEVLGLPRMKGLAEFLRGEIVECEIIRQLEPSSLSFVPAGHAPSEPGELLQGSGMSDFLKRAGERYDWIVVDSAPITLFADAPHLASLADGSLLVTRLGVTPANALQQAVAALEGNFIAGVVMNGDTQPEKYHYGYYDHSAGNVGAEEKPEELTLTREDSERG